MGVNFLFFTRADGQCFVPPTLVRKDAEKTMLTEFFTLCNKDNEAKDLIYPDVLKYYTWNNQTKEYSRRKRTKSFGSGAKSFGKLYHRGLF